MIKEITSKENNKIKFAASLKESKYRKENNAFLAEGRKSLDMALKAKVVREIFTLKPLKDIPDDIPQYKVYPDILKKVSNTINPEGIVFVCNIVVRKPKKLRKVLYLDHINDPGNMGTMIRTAYAFNFDAVVVSPESVDIYNEKVVAASKGALFDMPIFVATLEEIHQEQTLIVSALTDDAIELKEVNKPESYILVVGNEAHGVSEGTLKQADIITKISIQNIDSLNVSVAAGILMNHLK